MEFDLRSRSTVTDHKLYETPNFYSFSSMFLRLVGSKSSVVTWLRTTSSLNRLRIEAGEFLFLVSQHGKTLASVICHLFIKESLGETRARLVFFLPPV